MGENGTSLSRRRCDKAVKPNPWRRRSGVNARVGVEQQGRAEVGRARRPVTSHARAQRPACRPRTASGERSWAGGLWVSIWADRVRRDVDKPTGIRGRDLVSWPPRRSPTRHRAAKALQSGPAARASFLVDRPTSATALGQGVGRTRPIGGECGGRTGADWPQASAVS